jgi:hypothetical protein
MQQSGRLAAFLSIVLDAYYALPTHVEMERQPGTTQQQQGHGFE